jgi:hypothetical protein
VGAELEVAGKSLLIESIDDAPVKVSLKLLMPQTATRATGSRENY